MALPRERKSCTLCLSHSLTREQVGMHLDQSFEDGCYDEERAGSDWSRDAGSPLSKCLHFDHEDLFPYWIGVLLLYFEEILIV